MFPLLSALTKEQYLLTMKDGMQNITAQSSLEKLMLDYAKSLSGKYPAFHETLCLGEPEYVYQDNSGRFRHALFQGNIKNYYMVIISDKEQKNQYSHYILDLNEEYGLSK